MVVSQQVQVIGFILAVLGLSGIFKVVNNSRLMGRPTAPPQGQVRSKQAIPISLPIFSAQRARINRILLFHMGSVFVGKDSLRRFSFNPLEPRLISPRKKYGEYTFPDVFL